MCILQTANEANYSACAFFYKKHVHKKYEAERRKNLETFEKHGQAEFQDNNLQKLLLQVEFLSN